MSLREELLVRIPGLVLTTIALILLWHTFDPVYQDRLAGLQFGPVFFPQLVLGLWLCLAAPLIVFVPVDLRQTLLENRKYLPVVFFGMLLLAYVWILPWLGYLLSTLAFALALQLIVGDRKPLSLLIWSVVLSIGSWAAFEHVLEIVLPAGKWF